MPRGLRLIWSCSVVMWGLFGVWLFFNFGRLQSTFNLSYLILLFWMAGWGLILDPAPKHTFQSVSDWSNKVIRGFIVLGWFTILMILVLTAMQASHDIPSICTLIQDCPSRPKFWTIVSVVWLGMGGLVAWRSKS